ncbi:MAG: HlyC/CorC family transporter [Alphaproteobacteria bacterium]|nr:HlyC/CorC family transporter [Alphaproteobacteria bacterium]
MELSLVFAIIAIVVLLVLSAFFSGSETALTAASQALLKAREKEGDKRAALTNKIRDEKDRMIGALLLGNNLVNILASALATSVLIKLFGESGVIYATLLMTFLVLIFAEVLPKTYAFHHAESMSMRIAWIIRLVIIIFAPVTETVTWIVRKVLALFGVDISKVTAGSHLELLRGAIELHQGEGPKHQTQEQRAMLRSILDLVEVDIEDIMIHRKNVTMIDVDQPVKDIIREAMNSPYTRLPLWKGNPDNIVGVLHARELLREFVDVEGNICEINLKRVAMDPWFVPETTNLYDQLQAFRERKEHFAVVIDEYGSFMGIVTLEDILEEIVGDIDDEHDEAVTGVKRLSNGSYIIDGTVPIRDLNRAFDWGLPHEDYATIAGLVLYESQMVPDVGQSFRFHGFQIDVVRKQRNQITLVRLTPPKKDKVV